VYKFINFLPVSEGSDPFSFGCTYLQVNRSAMIASGYLVLFRIWLLFRQGKENALLIYLWPLISLSLL